MLPDGDMGIGGPLGHSCEALDSRRARQPLVDAKGYSRINVHKSGCVLTSVLGIGGCSHGRLSNQPTNQPTNPSAEVRHPALGYDHGVV